MNTFLQDHLYAPARGKIPASGYLEVRIRNIQRRLSKHQGGRKQSANGPVRQPVCVLL